MDAPTPFGQQPANAASGPAAGPPSGPPFTAGPATTNPKITHSKPGLGSPVVGGGGAEVSTPPNVNAIGMTGAPATAPPAPAVSKITAFGKERKHEEAWSRSPNTAGVGAIHVKTFHCKLTEDALQYMDQLVNEWLDAHPQYEVKFVSSTIGVMTGKLKEPALICQVWV